MLLVALVLPALLSGCLSHTRIVPQPVLTGPVKDATAEDLVESIDKNYSSISGLSATVDFQASVGGARKGKVTDYTSFSGYILLSKPEKLRVLGLVPVLHTRAFDLASDGKTFKLLIPSKNKVVEGPATLTEPSANPLENLRPGIFFDSLLIRSIDPRDFVLLTTEMRTREAGKQFIAEPMYDLTIGRQKADSQELIPRRVIHFSRQDLLPYQIDIYDEKGDIETQAIYGAYRMFGTRSYPETITIRRPLEEYQIVITIEKLTANQKMADDQFELKVPEGAQIQTVK